MKEFRFSLRHLLGGGSPLQEALHRGMKPGADLADELIGLGDYSIRSRQDARAICDALASLPLHRAERENGPSPLQALTALFQEVSSKKAFETLWEEGLPHLIRIF